jgi:hypothetical protein
MAIKIETSSHILTFDKFQVINKIRNVENFGHVSWPIQNWSLTIAGEAGELCNLVKKSSTW